MKDVILWPILKVIWEPFSKKRSHWWHWIEWFKWTNSEDIITPEHSVLVRGNRAAKPINNVWDEFIQLNFGWKTVAVLIPSDPEDENSEYHVGFERGNQREICAVVRKGETGVLIGKSDTKFFAFTRELREVRLKFLRYEGKKTATVTII